jgi:hypothetical protein
MAASAIVFKRLLFLKESDDNREDDIGCEAEKALKTIRAIRSRTIVSSQAHTFGESKAGGVFGNVEVERGRRKFVLGS